LIKYIKKRSLESSETPVLHRGCSVAKGKYTVGDYIHQEMQKISRNFKASLIVY